MNATLLWFRKQISSARQLYEVAVIVTAEYQEADDLMDAERHARKNGSRLAKAGKEKDEPEIRFEK